MKRHEEERKALARLIDSMYDLYEVTYDEEGWAVSSNIADAILARFRLRSNPYGAEGGMR